MPSPRVPIVETVSKAWIDAFRAHRAMPVVAICALVILAAIAVVAFFAVEAILMNPGRSVKQWLESPTWFVFVVFNSSIQIVLLVPLAMAVQRFVIRRDIARWYPLHPLRPSYLHYVGTALALNLAYRSPDLISILLPEARELPYAVNFAIALVTFILMIVVVIAAVRKIALFAAIAVNAPNANWRAFAPADAGNTFRIVLVLLGVLLPAAVCGALLNAYLPIPRWPNETGGLVLAFAMVLLQLPTIIAFGAAVARIYMAIGTAAVPMPASPVSSPAQA
jgi:hypothetical protein